MGREILIREEELQPLEENSYYQFQILGFSVVTKNGEEIGTVEDLWRIPDNDLLVVRRGKETVFIPFAKTICIRVDLNKREIVIDPPEGLLDLNEI